MGESNSLAILENWREDPAALTALIDRANEGDKAVLPMLREVLAERPDVWRFWGDWSRRNMDLILSDFKGSGLAILESVRRYSADLKARLAGPEATPIESLLVDRIALCWLHVHIAEGVYTQNPNDGTQRRFDRAQRMYLQAIKALATVRRLQIPAMQVNIGDKQINVGS